MMMILIPIPIHISISSVISRVMIGSRQVQSGLRASLAVPVKVQTEKLEFSLPKTCLRVAKLLARNRPRKLKLKNGKSSSSSQELSRSLPRYVSPRGRRLGPWLQPRDWGSGGDSRVQGRAERREAEGSGGVSEFMRPNAAKIDLARAAVMLLASCPRA
jgi:hypothetical protein